MSDAEHHIESNRRNWDQRVPIHLDSRAYGEKITTPRDGGDCLGGTVAEELGDVAGKRIVHLQCHIGVDTLSLARRGAQVTGVDLSEPAIEAARGLAAESDLETRFVVADVHDATTATHGKKFDLVFATYGVLCWIGDLRGWMEVAATLLRPGGELYLRDAHGLQVGLVSVAGQLDAVHDDRDGVMSCPHACSALNRARGLARVIGCSAGTSAATLNSRRGWDDAAEERRWRIHRLPEGAMPGRL